MLKENVTPLTTVKQFYDALLIGGNLSAAASYCSADIVITGVSPAEPVQGREAFFDYLLKQQNAGRLSHSFCLAAESEHFITQSIAAVTLTFELKEGSGHYFHGSYVLALEAQNWLLHHIDIVPPETKEHLPLALAKQKIFDTRQELLSSSIAGGLMGGYAEENFPFYYVNERMLSYLGYDSEEEFVSDIDGYISHCMHPDDRKAVDDAVASQLASSDEYTVEYRMRKKNGSYIYVHDIGRLITAEDGRPAILSVCIDISDQQFELQQNESMIRALNGSTFLGIFKNDACTPTYMSPEFGNMIGYSKQSMYEVMSKGFVQLIHPMDKERFIAAQRRACNTEDSVEGTYRVLHKNGHYLWIMGICQCVGKEGDNPILRYVFASRSKQFELQNEILCGIDTGIIAIDPVSYDICLINEAAFKIMDRPVHDCFGRKCYEVMRGLTHPCDNCLLSLQEKQTFEAYVPKLEKTLSVTVKDAVWMDKPVRIETISDISEQKRIQEELRLGEQRLTAAIRHAGLQFWEYDAQHERAYMSELSQKSYGVPKIMENFPESFLALGLVHEEDEASFRLIHQRLKDGAAAATLEFRTIDSAQEYHWQLLRYTADSLSGQKPLRAFATAESLDRLKATEENFAIAARLTGVRVWTVDIVSRTICFNTPGSAEFGRTFPCGTEAELLALDLFAPEDVHESWQNLLEMFEWKDSVTFRAHLKTGDKYRWNRVVHTVLSLRSGLRVKAIGVSIDIHEHVLLEQRFEQEMEYSSQLQASNLITKVRCNITNGTVDMYAGTDNTSVMRSGESYDEGAENLALAAVKPEEQAQIRYYLDRERVQKAYATGESSYDLVYLRRGRDQSVFWAHTVVKTYQDPATDDLMSFMYTYNIDDQKMAEAIVNRVVDTNFEYLTLFNAYTGIVEKTIDKADAFFKPEEGAAYEASAKIGLSAMLSAEEYALYIPLFSLKNITNQLTRNGNYSYSFDILEPGHVQKEHKLWVFNWFDDLHTRILCSRSDITEVHRHEQQQKEALSAALAAAKKANMAKSDFLSRMSHEIRTPMNAIIGMTAIAIHSIDNGERMANCLEKIDSASHFLLSLINDILDMSRIESGKTTLKKGPIEFIDLIDSLNTICCTQAEAKRVNYECIVSPFLDERYIGDGMKLQQVLVNILGNAIKFTKSGGKVTFKAENGAASKSGAALRFTIRDTGIGMNEAFLPRLFTPFEQEESGITSGFGGTGLGLSISKSIVDMMDGNITVHSKKGVGTEFIVDVKLETAVLPQGDAKRPPFADYSLKALVAGDDKGVLENALLALKELGVVAEAADTSARAAELVRRQKYDLIFVDLGMPGPNGIEVCRQIHEILGKGGAKIILTAYDWYPIEQEAKAAGVDLLMSKPFLKERLTATIFEALDKKKAKASPSAVQKDFDFTGKRLLLAEDNYINAEIAETLLMHVGFSVDVAKNGRAAVDMFEKSAPFYYDAILMDIRMPIMDGLQASTEIRKLNKRDAKTIPIIAMTADAFDEDAEKSKAAGMNRHLSKPIDPPMLYETLRSFIKTEEI